MESNKKVIEQFKGRQKFMYKDQLVYEWEQSIDDVLIYIKTPEALQSKNKEIIKKNLQKGQEMPKLEVKFSTTRLKIGIKGLPPYLDEDLYFKVKESECLWQMEDDEISITLPKTLKAETWPAAFKGHDQLNPLQLEAARKKMHRERFQEEHGGFDFSDAEINGNIPDPRNFMGGIK